MVSIWNAFKSLALWQIAVLAVVLFGAAGATYGGYVRGTSPDLVDLEENQQLIPVKYGDLINEITTNGSLVFPNRETLSFGSPGTVMEILVEEGSPVTAGQVLAKLDATSVASLAQQVAQRELDLNDFTEILEETRAIDPLELAQKKEAVASARFQSKEAIDALEDAREPYTAQEIETQRQLVANTRLDLQSAERALAGLARDHAVQLAQAREVKTNADLTFDVSRQELSDFARDYTQQVALAQQVQASAELALDTARESLDDLPRIHTDDLAQARQDQADAQVALDLAQRGLAAYSPDYNLELAEAGEEAALAATALDQAEQALVDFHRDYNTQLGQARLDEPVAQSELKAARDALEAYENANTRWLEQDRAKRIDLNAQLAKINASIDSAINSSNAGLTGLGLRIITLQQSKQFLQEDLADTLESLVADDRLVASVELNVAKLEQTQQDLARLELGPDPIRRRQLESAVEVARTTLTDTEQELTRLEQGPDPLQRRDLEAAVELAEAGLRVDWYSSLKIASVARDIDRFAATRSIYLPGGFVPVGEWSGPAPIIQLDGLANTLRRLATEGPDSFYSGPLANDLLADARSVGISIQADDLTAYRPQCTEISGFGYRGATVFSPPGLCAGPTLQEALTSLQSMMPTSSATPDAKTYVHYANSMQAAYEHRLQSVGDSPDGKSPSCTTHLNVIDRQGNVVALTQTLLSLFGSKVVLPETGILMNNGIMWFDPRPGRANSIAAGKQPLSNMCPAIVQESDGSRFTLGASGGRRIMSAVLQLISFLVDFSMDLESAMHHLNKSISPIGILSKDQLYSAPIF